MPAIEPASQVVRSQPRISLVVCTRNRAARLRQTLAFVRQLELPWAWELVVVNNGSTDETDEVLAAFAREFNGTFVATTEPLPGLGRGHARGLDASSGAIVAFIDDDCYPATDFLQQVCSCFEEQPCLGYLGGRILLHDPDDLPLTIKTSEARHELPARSFVPTGFIQGANMAFRREALLQAGGFDVSLGPGTPFNCEDIDAVARVSAAGWAGAYDPRPLVRHHHGRRTQTERDALRRSYDHGRGAYYARCFLNAPSRRVCLQYLLATIPKQRLRRTWRELAGALHYLLRAATPHA